MKTNLKISITLGALLMVAALVTLRLGPWTETASAGKGGVPDSVERVEDAIIDVGIITESLESKVDKLETKLDMIEVKLDKLTDIIIIPPPR